MRMNRSQGLRPKAASGIAVSVRRCLDCGLIFSDPRPEPDSLEDHYGIPPEEYWQSDEALSWNANYFSGPIATAKKLIRKPAIAALDIGAGTGKAMRSMTAAGFNCWGLEPAENFHRHALQFVPKDRLALSTIEDYSRQERSFDFVTFGAVLEHLFDPAGALRKALELTSPGGIIHLEVPSSDWLVARLVDFYYRLIGTNFTTHISPMHSPFHLYEFTRRSFDMHGAQAGYEVEEMKIEVCEVPHVPSAAKLALTGIMEATGTGMQLVIYLRKRVTK
jgi:SAM-dependent methyltransferase